MSTARGFDSDWLQKLRDSNDIVSTISNYVPVVKKGKNYWANCPFHHEKTPSFCVNEVDQFFHCFGCGVSGDVITFIMKIESVEFLDAIKLLADKCGMKIPEFQGEQEVLEKKKKKDLMLSMLKDANLFYRNNFMLSEGENARNYIKARGLAQQQIDDFGIGCSLGWNGLIDYLKRKKYSDEDMVEVGMAGRNDAGKLYDFFAFRLMFPLYNKFGDCIGFSGRDIKGESQAKYKNSIQSLVFDKGSTVFALNLVRKLKQTQEIKNIIICEGQMDVIAMHGAGFNTAVACLGTAITDKHAKEISRLTNSVILCLDGDGAGQNATMKAIPILLNQGLEVRVASLVGGKDPDEIIKTHGKEKMQEIISNVEDCTIYQIKCLAKQYDLKDNMGKSKFLSEVFNLMKKFPHLSEREMYIPLISSLTNVQKEVLREDMSTLKVSENTFENQDKGFDDLPYNNDSVTKSQQFIIASLVNNCPYVKFPDGFTINIKDKALNDLFLFVMEKKKNGENLNKAIIFDIFNGEITKQISDILTFDIDEFGENSEAYFKDCLKKVRLFELKLEQEKLAKLRKTETDSSKIREYILKTNELIKLIKKIDSEE